MLLVGHLLEATKEQQVSPNKCQQNRSLQEAEICCLVHS